MVLKNKNPQNRPVDLPDFGNPPVIEVLLSLQFAELEKFKTVQAGLLWDQIFRKKSYVQIAEQPRLESSFEVLGKKQEASKALDISVNTTPETPRLWFMKDDNIELVQIQSDRLVHNWRKRKQKNIYPRYENIKKEFFSEFRKMKKFLRKENLGEIQLNQCEITYVNHIHPINSPEEIWKNLNEIFQFWKRFNNAKGLSEETVLGGFEGVNVNFRQPIFNNDGDFMGRFYFSLEPALTFEKEEILRFVLSVKGPPIKPTLKAASEFFDMGRNIIVNNFALMTTNKMHEIWERKN